MTTHESLFQITLADALRQIFNQVSRLLEEPESSLLLGEGGPLAVALTNWRGLIAAKISEPSIQRTRELQDARLELMGKIGLLEKECADLRERNELLRDEIVRLNQREEGVKKQLLDARFVSNGHHAEAKRLDLEIRDLRRKIREMEGGPPLTPSEAAPRSKRVTTEVGKPAPGPDASPLAAATTEAPRFDPRAAAEAAFRAMCKPALKDVTASPVPSRATRVAVEEKAAAPGATETREAKPPRRKKTKKRETQAGAPAPLKRKKPSARTVVPQKQKKKKVVRKKAANPAPKKTAASSTTKKSSARTSPAKKKR